MNFDIEAKDSKGRTPLLIAVQNEDLGKILKKTVKKNLNLDTIIFLLENHANIKAIDNEGKK